MCNAFASAGNEVSLLTTNRHTDITQPLEVFYGTPINFSVVKLSVPDIVARINLVPHVLRALAYSIQRAFFAAGVYRFMRKNTFDLVYARDEWLLLLLYLFTKVPMVWESHQAKYGFAAKVLLKLNVPCVCISEGIRDLYLSKRIKADQLMVAHDGIDASFLEEHISKEAARRQLGLDSEKNIVMYIGGLDKWKGVDTFFKASIKIPKVSFVVIGGKMEEIEVYRKQYPQIVFLGPRPYKELRFHQQAADALVIPNTAKNELSASYTSPLKLFAHMTSKIPLVLSNIRSLRSVLNEEQAFFFEPDSPQSLADTILNVLKHTVDSHEKAENAYEVSKKYTWENRSKEILSFINSK